MARPPLPADRRRDVYVGLRLTGAEARPAQDIADAEHAGNLSAAIRALVAEALTNGSADREVRDVTRRSPEGAFGAADTVPRRPRMTIAEFTRQIADAYGPEDEVDAFMIKAGSDARPIFWPPFRVGWVAPADREDPCAAAPRPTEG